ncbi:antitoxin VbhA family protein [Rhizobium sp. TRM95111]|uniref:antitoxin VbhA family protein n=1 Tax=Rhizobium alarense TaxID=2846851 RepID=UPI001F178348|nr:antitoxin VbhA family protein [Rhizobium alarense]MCF3643341.1 antitoxin VbhA family protein [Rhizobium alarense]
MSKEVSMTIRVEPQLRIRFNEAAERQHRPAAQLIREFMHRYVEHVHKTDSAHSIGAAESERRRQAVINARASVGLEGFKITDDDEEQALRFITGEIDLADFVKVSNEQAAER